MSELTTLFTNIANAIRSKTGDTSAIPAANFSSAINDIAVAQIKEVTTSGGSTSITVPGINGKSFMFTATAQKEGNGMLLYGYSSGNGFTYFLIGVVSSYCQAQLKSGTIAGDTLTCNGGVFLNNTTYKFVVW